MISIFNFRALGVFPGSGLPLKKASAFWGLRA